MPQYKDAGIMNYTQLFKLTKYVDDIPLEPEEANQIVIAGGVFKSIFSKQPVKDVDIFFLSTNAKEITLGWYNDLVALSDEPWEYSYNNDRVDAFYNTETKVRVELITGILYNTVTELLNSFDFTITKFAMFLHLNREDEPTWSVKYHVNYFEHLMLKRLVIDTDTELQFPLSTWERSYKYAQRDFLLCRESKVYLANQMLSSVSGDGITEDDLVNGFYRGID